MDGEKNELLTTLENFKERFNANSLVKKLIKKWDRSIMLESIDTGSNYSMIIEGQELNAIKEGFVEWDPPVRLQAEEVILCQIFSGQYNPATALIDGVLAVFSEERDKVKLEAIAMIVWGL